MRMHVGRVHGNMKTKRPPGETPETQKAALALKRRNYQRIWRQRRQNGRSMNNGAFTIGFCPRCGMNLEVLATALAVVNKSRS